MPAGSEYVWLLPYNLATTDEEVAEQWRESGMSGITKVHVDEIVQRFDDGAELLENHRWEEETA